MRHGLSGTNTAKALTAAFIGTGFIIFVVMSYIGEFERCCEMTFLSNFATGIFMLVAAVVIMATGRDLPHFLYLDATALLLTVVCVCTIFAPDASFRSPGVVLHLVNPIIMLTFYLIFCDARVSSYGMAATALVFPSAYYGFMIAFGYFAHNSVYERFDTNAMSVGRLVMFGFLAVAVITVISFSSMFLNRALHNLYDGASRARAAKREARREAKR